MNEAIELIMTVLRRLDLALMPGFFLLALRAVPAVMTMNLSDRASDDALSVLYVLEDVLAKTAAAVDNGKESVMLLVLVGGGLYCTPENDMSFSAINMLVSTGQAIAGAYVLAAYARHIKFTRKLERAILVARIALWV